MSFETKLTELINTVTGLMPNIGLLVVLAAAVVFAFGRLTPEMEMRAKANTWATGLFVSGLTVTVFSTLAPAIISWASAAGA